VVSGGMSVELRVSVGAGFGVGEVAG